jgi:hypothetical protein
MPIKQVKREEGCTHVRQLCIIEYLEFWGEALIKNPHLFQVFSLILLA